LDVLLIPKYSYSGALFATVVTTLWAAFDSLFLGTVQQVIAAMHEAPSGQMKKTLKIQTHL
jgi:hypothetical protein